MQQSPETLLNLLKEHAQCYPAMEPRDAVKLLYQQTFGGGHLVTYEAACAEWIEKERAQAPAVSQPFESIGGGLLRMHLGHPAIDALPSALLARIFCVSSAQPRDGMPAFLEKLDTLREAARQNFFAFSLETLDVYLQEYLAAGCPMVRHSEAFNRAYRPAYRVIDSRFAAVWPLLAPLWEKAQQNGRFTLALDGMAASGKSTAADLLQLLFGGSIVHLDDFFLPPKMRTAERLAAPGGNVHYERFCEEVVEPLRRGESFVYRVFDCGRMAFNGTSDTIDPTGNIIIEGSYALHPAFGALPNEPMGNAGRYPIDHAAFLRVDPELQHKRILRRNGEAMLRMFETRWIPMENAYRAAWETRLAPFDLPVEEENA